jgi:hypothetical protein
MRIWTRAELSAEHGGTEVRNHSIVSGHCVQRWCINASDWPKDDCIVQEC